MIPLGPMTPDTASLGGTGLDLVQNAVPFADFYGPFKSLDAITAALAAKCMGAYMARTTADNYVLFAGTTTKLYKYDQAGAAWTDVSRASAVNYAVSAGSYWAFAQFGTNVVATNVNDVLQFIDVDSGTTFEAVADTPPQSAYVTTVGDFLVLSGISGFPRRVKWSGLNNMAQWTAGTNNSDYQDFADGGDVLGVSGLESGIVFQRDTMRQMTFQPSSPAVFSFQRIQGSRGVFAPYSIIGIGDVSFYYTNSGFFVASGAQVQPIGVDQIDEYFKSDALPSQVVTMQGVADPRNTRIYWGYISNSNSGSNFDKMIGYDWKRQKWFTAIENLEVLAASATLGYTLEGLDAFGTVDSITTSFDSPIWAGGTPALGGVSTAHKFGFFTGMAKEATFETSDLQFNPPQRAFVSAVIPYFNSTDIAVSISSAENRSSVASYSAESALGVDAKAPLRSSGRYHRLRFRVPSGSVWTEFQAFDAEFSAEGDR